MPVKPKFTWEQTQQEVLLHVTIKGFKPEAVDVFITDAFVKVNAAPTYLLLLDLLHSINTLQSSYIADKTDEGCLIHIKLQKAEVSVIWDALCINKDVGKDVILTRRAAAIERAEAEYNAQLTSRATQRDAEQRRLTEKQWEVEKEQRALIERRMKEEKRAAEADLYKWEHAQKRKNTNIHTMSTTKEHKTAKNGMLSSPADIIAQTMSNKTVEDNTALLPTKQDENNINDNVNVKSEADSDSIITTDTRPELPHVRGAETLCVSIDFTPRLLSMPSRSRGDDEYYRKSKYKPVSIEDSPMFWKDRGDAQYKVHNWKDAAHAYSESIKRDGVFLTCVMNRAACYLQMMELKKAIDDCTLALTLLGNTPASEITQDRYRYLMAKLHARRGAAYGWKEEYHNALSDLKVALAYTNPESEATEFAQLNQDIAHITSKMKEKNCNDVVMRDVDCFAPIMQKASGLYYQSKFEEARIEYEKILSDEPYHVNARGNYIATLLHCGKFKDALNECNKQIEFCGEVASALNEPGGLSNMDLTDSDDEDEAEIEVEDKDQYSEEIIDDEITKIEGTSSGRSTSILEKLSNIAQENDREQEQEELQQHLEKESHQQHNKVNNADDAVKRRKAAAKLISERSTHVYILLKAYVRAAAALCGLKDFRQAHVYLQNALRITPYDNDLLDDCNRIAEKVRMDTLVAATTAKVELKEGLHEQ